jgi:hypothetical protein
MKGFTKIEGVPLFEVLKKAGRQYLVGNLTRPQEINHINDKDIEIGITCYDVDTEELPHWHPIQKEFQFMLEGYTCYKNSITNETISFKKNDFYFIEPKNCYAQFSKTGTKILFIKIPTIDDKTTCAFCDKKCENRVTDFIQFKEIIINDEQ